MRTYKKQIVWYFPDIICVGFIISRAIKPRKKHWNSKNGLIAQSTSSSGSPQWRQSPIDINEVYTMRKKFPPLLLDSYWRNDGCVTMTNTGKTIKIEFGDDRRIPILRGGPLKNNDYQFENLQFRWGTDDCRGAEHSINNYWYSMEAQAMHWNKLYGSIDKCYDKPDGIAILSYLIQVVGCPGAPDNPVFANVTRHLPNIRKMGDDIKIPPDSLWWMAEACLSPGYYTYSGSMTDPPYQECAVWIVIPRPIKASSNQVEKFRRILNYKREEVRTNFRAQQPLRGRQVFYADDFAVA